MSDLLSTLLWVGAGVLLLLIIMRRRKRKMLQ
jgi:LPXTG-motif cell wall-anchored protein